jgi:hypothetical protein
MRPPSPGSAASLPCSSRPRRPTSEIFSPAQHKLQRFAALTLHHGIGRSKYASTGNLGQLLAQDGQNFLLADAALLARHHAGDDGALIDLAGRTEADQGELGKNFGMCSRRTASAIFSRESV